MEILMICHFLFLDYAECGTLGTGCGAPVGGPRTRHRFAARVFDDATAVGQRLESFGQFTESAAARRPRPCRDGQTTASHAASRRPLRRPVRFRHGGDPLHGRNFVPSQQGNTQFSIADTVWDYTILSKIYAAIFIGPAIMSPDLQRERERKRRLNRALACVIRSLFHFSRPISPGLLYVCPALTKRPFNWALFSS